MNRQNLGHNWYQEDQMMVNGMNHSYSSLRPELGDDVLTSDYPSVLSAVTYEKGFQLLYYLETLIGEHFMQKML